MNRYFEHIFIVSACKFTERRQYMDKQMEYLGVKDYTYWYVPDYNFTNSLIFKDNPAIDDAHKRCIFGHYSLWKICYELGYDNVLIIEDDAKFISNISEYNRILKEFDDNRNLSNIYLFDYIDFDIYENNIDAHAYMLCTCYYVNNKGLKYLIDKHETYNMHCDSYFVKSNNPLPDSDNNDLIITNVENNGYTYNIRFNNDDILGMVNVASKRLCIQCDKEYINKKINIDEYKI